MRIVVCSGRVDNEHLMRAKEMQPTPRRFFIKEK